jgi:predicted RNA-binding Zn-ribbon protein involved in translation (DUF1610 family)
MSGMPPVSKWQADYLANLVRELSSETLMEYADGKIQTPQSVRYPVFLSKLAPWLAEPGNAMVDDNIRRVDVRFPAGSAKSLLGELVIAFFIEHAPGPLYYVWQTDEDAGDAMEDRVMPMLEGNEVLASRLPGDPRKKRRHKLLLPGMPFYAVGANRSAAQSKRIRYLLLEEPHLYDAGMYSAFLKRIEGVRGAKVLSFSTGSVHEDESDKTYSEGSCEEWEVPCPHCGEFQVMTDNKDRLKSDRNEETVDTHGNIVWPKLLASVRYNCEKCGRDWPRGATMQKDEDRRLAQAQLGRYKRTNPNARADHRSFHMEAPSVSWLRLEDVVEEKLKSSYAARRGSLEPLKDYIQKRRAMPWDDRPPDDATDIEKIKSFYLKRSLMDNELARQLTFDNQHGRARLGEGAHRWYVCRSYSSTESRLVDEGRITTWEEAEELRVKLQVKPERTLVDVAWDTQNVQSVCIKYGWQGLWGDNTNKANFPHHEFVMVNGKQERVVRHLPFSSVNLGHVGIGRNEKGEEQRRQARYFFWCNQPIRALYHRLIDGLCAYKWSVAADTSEDFVKHIKSEYLRDILDAKGNKKKEYHRANVPDHLLDCDQMNLVSALLDAKLRPMLISFLDEVTVVPGTELSSPSSSSLTPAPVAA